jgi:hypothetical protein
MSKIERETAISLPSSFAVPEPCNLTALTPRTGRSMASLLTSLAGVIKRRWQHSLPVAVEAGVRRCGHAGVLADYVSARRDSDS